MVWLATSWSLGKNRSTTVFLGNPWPLLLSEQLMIAIGGAVASTKELIDEDALPWCATRRIFTFNWSNLSLYWANMKASVSHVASPATMNLSEPKLRSEEHTSELQSLRHL